MANKIVTFVKDVYPYCRGDVRNLDTSVLADVDKVAKGLKLGKVYVEGEKDLKEAEADAEAGVKAAKAAIRQGLPSVRAAVTSEDVVAPHEQKTILGDGSVGVPAAPAVVDADPATTQPAGQAAEELPAVKTTKKATKTDS